PGARPRAVYHALLGRALALPLLGAHPRPRLAARSSGQRAGAAPGAEPRREPARGREAARAAPPEPAEGFRPGARGLLRAGPVRQGDRGLSGSRRPVRGPYAAPAMPAIHGTVADGRRRVWRAVVPLVPRHEAGRKPTPPHRSAAARRSAPSRVTGN